MATAAMLGYIQEGSIGRWRDAINGWLVALAGQVEAGMAWTDGESLREVEVDVARAAAIHESSHARVDSSTDTIRLYHLWIDLTGSRPADALQASSGD